MPANQRIAVPVPQLGINKSRPPWNIDDTYCVKARDILLDQIGYARRRGPFALVSGAPAMTYASPGLTQAANPQGAHRVAVMQGDGSGNKLLSFLAAAYTSIASSYTWPHAVSRSTIFAAAPAMKRGTFIGTSDRYDGQSTVQALALWRGAINNDTSGGTTITATRGSKTVTGAGSFSAAVTPGAHLFATTNTVTGTPTTLIGVVQSVSGSTVTLEEPALAGVAAGQTPDFRAVRGVNPRVATGTITCGTGAATVQGGGTRFKAQGLGSGVWQLFRARDLTFIGEVTSVTSDIALTFTANAAIAMDNEFYVAIQMDGDFSISTTSSNWSKKLGFLTCSYSSRQWYFNSRRVGDSGNYQIRGHYSSQLDPEAVDISEDGGTWVPVNSTSGYNYPVIGVFATYAGILLFKQNEVLILTGDDPSNFSIRQLLGTDGALGPGTVVQHDGGAIWAGRRGVYHFDGVSVNDVSAALGDGYQAQMISFDPETYRAYAFKHRNHYMLSIESTTGEPYYNTSTGTSTAASDAILTAKSTLRAFLPFDEDLSEVAGDFPSASQIPGWANMCPPGRNVGSAYGKDNYTGVPNFATSTDVPSGIAGDASTKTYWFGPMNASNNAAGSQTLAADTIRLQKVRLEHGGPIVSVSAFLDGSGAGTGSQVAKAVVYTNSAGPLTKLATSNEVTVTDGQAFAAVTFTFAGGETIPAGDVWVGIHGGGNTNTIRIATALYPSAFDAVLSNADTYSDGAAATYVGSAATGQSILALGISITASPTARSIDFSNSLAPNYPDSAEITKQPVVTTGTQQNGASAYAHLDLAQPFSIGGWVKVTTMPDGTANSVYAGICGIGDDGGSQNRGYGLWYDNTGVVYFTRIGDVGGANPADASRSVSTAAGVVAAGAWHHIVGVANGASLTIYIDGLLAGTNAAADTSMTTLYGTCEWGRNMRDVAISGQINYHRGLLHRMFLIQEALSAANIFSLANPSSSGSVPSVTTATTLTQQTYILNLYSGAWSTMTNFMHRGGINLPAETAKKTWAILTNSSSVAKLVEVESMFTATGTDDVETSETSTQTGPRMHIEYRRFSFGDASQLAYWDKLVAKIKVTGSTLSVFVVPDFGTDGFTLGDTIAVDTDFDPPKKVRIDKRSTHMGLRIYEAPTTTAVTDAYIGPADLTFKPMRLGRSVHA